MIFRFFSLIDGKWKTITLDDKEYSELCKDFWALSEKTRQKFNNIESEFVAAVLSYNC